MLDVFDGRVPNFSEMLDVYDDIRAKLFWYFSCKHKNLGTGCIKFLYVSQRRFEYRKAPVVFDKSPSLEQSNKHPKVSPED